MSTNELKLTIIKMYKDAFSKGTDKAWKSYYKKLTKLAKENDAQSPEVLENWVFNN